MRKESWPFDQPPNCAVLTVREIVFDGAPILCVAHDADDQGWQFLGATDPDPSRAVVVGLSEIVELDPSVLEVADLPPGWSAKRVSITAAWQRYER